MNIVRKNIIRVKHILKYIKGEFMSGYNKGRLIQKINTTNTVLGIGVQVKIGQGYGGAIYDSNNKTVLMDTDIVSVIRNNNFDLNAVTLLLKEYGLPINDNVYVHFIYLHEVGHHFTYTKEKEQAELNDRLELIRQARTVVDRNDLYDIAIRYRQLPLEREADLWAINALKILINKKKVK